MLDWLKYAQSETTGFKLGFSRGEAAELDAQMDALWQESVEEEVNRRLAERGLPWKFSNLMETGDRAAMRNSDTRFSCKTLERGLFLSCVGEPFKRSVRCFIIEFCGYAIQWLRENVMAKPKIVMWLFIVAGLLWILAGTRDLFAPGFFSISGHPVNGSGIAVNFAIGIVFLIIASLQAVRTRSHKDKS